MFVVSPVISNVSENHSPRKKLFSIKRSFFTDAFPNIKFIELLNKPPCEEIKHFALEFQTMQESRRMHRLKFCINNDKDEGNASKT